MLCPTCSTQAPADSIFCPKCGHRLADPAPAGGKTPVEKLRGDRPTNSEPERPLWEGSYSPKAMYGQWLLAIVLTLVAIVLSVIIPNPITWMAAGAVVVIVWFCLAAFYLYERLSVHYKLTSQRFVHQTGLLRRVINRVEVIDIDDVTVEQGLIERMFGVGTIKLLSSDTSDPKLLLRGIDDVKRVATLIDDARRDERRKRGMYIETV
ncbi:MAG: PH domain-containing protein [Planctomycetaceae bacterium]|nr:PH domain-containing protein [Planctomycetaceae bacterium]